MATKLKATMRNLASVASFLLLVVVLLCNTLVNASQSSRPHIIFIMADDLGWNDVSFHGSKQIPTPNIDYWAHQGIILNNYYVCNLCTPSRGSLLTGLYPTHTGLQHSVIRNDEPYGLPLDKVLLPQKLKEIGYATHLVGKWHLGFFHKQYTPTYRGFDSHFGYWTAGEDYYDRISPVRNIWGFDFHHNLSSTYDSLMRYSTDLFTDSAVHLINQHNSSQPLFLYLAYQAVHVGNPGDPLQAPPEYIARFPYIKNENRRTYAGMVSALDEGVGVVLNALRERNFLTNSIVIFSTDNGGPTNAFMFGEGSNWPLRGMKMTLWEGGVRGSAFVWSPLLKKQKRVSKHLMHITDWFPTLLHAAGYKGDIGEVDGHNLWHTLSIDSPNPRSEVLLNIDPINNTRAIIVGKYKLIGGMQIDGGFDGWYGPSGRKDVDSDELDHPASPAKILCGPKPRDASRNCKPEQEDCVFDLHEDPCEYHNIAQSVPLIRDMLIQRLAHYNHTAIPPGNKPRDTKANPKYYNNEWVNWMDYDTIDFSLFDLDKTEYNERISVSDVKFRI